MFFKDETKETIILAVKIAALYAAVVGFTLFVTSNV
tara:strand:- start:158 stop:265 length:108 start_codon:yes stop_codon:yes gene_type:complete